MPAPALTAAMDALLMIEPPPLSFMYRAGALGADDDAEEVHAHDPGEVLEVVGQEPLERAADPGVVEHDVEAAEAVDGEVDQRLHLVRVADIGLLEGGRLADARGDLLTPVRRRHRRSRRSLPRPRATRRSPDRYPRHRRSRSRPSRRAPATSCRDHTVSSPLEPASRRSIGHPCPFRVSRVKPCRPGPSSAPAIVVSDRSIPSGGPPNRSLPIRLPHRAGGPRRRRSPPT